MSTDILLIQIAEAAMRSHIPTDLSLEQRIAAAFRYVRKADERNLFYLAPGPVTDDLKMRAALGAVMLSRATTREDNDLIIRSLAPLRALDAALSGVPVNFVAALADVDNILPILKLWHDAA